MEKDTATSTSEVLSALKPYYEINKPSVIKTSAYGISDKYNDAKTSELLKDAPRDYDLIAHGIYLGRIPTDTFELPDVSVKLIISVVESFELAGNGLIGKNTYPLEEWAKQGIRHVHLNMPDFSAKVNYQEVAEIIKLMREYIEGGSSVYVHCKAGRSRSAMVCAGYLSVYGDGNNLPPQSDFEQVVSYIKAKRSQVKMGLGKQEAIKKIVAQYEALLSKNLASTDYANQAEYLASAAAKNQICNLTSFKKLKIYAQQVQYEKTLSFMRTCYRTEYIQELFDKILNANDDAWYIELEKSSGTVEKILKPHGKPEDDVKLREQLIEDFLREVKVLLRRNVSTLKQNETSQTSSSMLSL